MSWVPNDLLSFFKIKSCFAKMPFEFLSGNTDKPQLYFDHYLWYRLRDNYNGCIDPSCSARISTLNGELKEPNKPLPKHRHEAISRDEFKIRKHFPVIKKRIEKEIHTWPSLIFDEEIVKLQTEQHVSKEAIAEYIKPYSYYQSSFEKRRAKKPTKIPKLFEEFLFKNFPEYTKTLDKKDFLQYDNKDASNRIIIFASEIGKNIFLLIVGSLKGFKS